jgi:hypothetical protein
VSTSPADPQFSSASEAIEDRKPDTPYVLDDARVQAAVLSFALLAEPTRALA